MRKMKMVVTIYVISMLLSFLFISFISNNTSAILDLYEFHDDSDVSSTNEALVYGSQWYAQTFTTEEAHDVSMVRLYFWDKTGTVGDCIVSIQNVDENGHPDGTDLCSCSLNADSWNLPAWINFTFDSPVNLSANTKYAIVIRCPDATFTNWLKIHCTPPSSGGTNYALGESLESSDSGSTWSEYLSSADFSFEVWGTGKINVTTYITDEEDVSSTWAILRGRLISDGGEPCVCGFWLSTDLTFGDEDDINYTCSGLYEDYDYFEYNATGLSPLTEYYYKAWAKNSAEFRNASNVESFTTDVDYSIIYVDDDAPSSWYNLIHVHTINEATNNVTEGGTIYVWNGTYNEVVTIQKSVSIVGNGSSTIVFASGDECFRVKNTQNVDISYIRFVNSSWGVYIQSSSSVRIFECEFENNDFAGIEIDENSHNNLIYHNKFINNAKQAIDNGSSNQWDNGYPSGGNYWNDYTGADLNGDGIGDTPYLIYGTADAKDRYPLVYDYFNQPETNATVVVYPPVEVGAYHAILNGSIINASGNCGFWVISRVPDWQTEPIFTQNNIDYNFSVGYVSNSSFTKIVILGEDNFKYWVKAWAIVNGKFIISNNTINFTTGSYSNMWDGLPETDFVTNTPAQGSVYYGNFCLQNNRSDESDGFIVTKWLDDGIENLSISLHLASNGGNNDAKIIVYYYNYSTYYIGDKKYTTSSLLGSETVFDGGSYPSWTYYSWNATFSGINKSRVNKIKIIFSGGTGGCWLNVDNVIVSVDGWNTVYESFGDEWGIYYPDAITTQKPDNITWNSATLYGQIYGDGYDPNGCIAGFKVWDDLGNVYWVEAGSGYYAGDYFSATITGLEPYTKYYVKAFANNTAGHGLDSVFTYNFTTKQVIYSDIYYFTTELINISNPSPANNATNVSINGTGVVVSVNVTHPYSSGKIDIEWYYYDWDSENWTLFATDTNVSSGRYGHLCTYFNQTYVVYYWLVIAYESGYKNLSTPATAVYYFSSQNLTITLEDEYPTSGTTNISWTPNGILTSVYLNYSQPSPQKVNLYWYYYDPINSTWVKYGEDLNVGEGRYWHRLYAINNSYLIYWKVAIGNATAGFYNFSLFNYSTIYVVNPTPSRGASNVTLISGSLITEITIMCNYTLPSQLNISWYYYDWASSSWIKYGENHSVKKGYTYRQRLTYPKYSLIYYYWRVDAEIFPIEVFNFSTDLFMTSSNPSPSSGSVINLTSPNSITVSATINQTYGLSMNISFLFLKYTFNETGYLVNSTWIYVQNYTNVGNGTYSATITVDDKFLPGVTYYWRIDGKEVDNPIDPTIDIYNFTVSPETPSITLLSPANGSTNVSFLNVNLTWTASDPTNDTLTYWVYFGKDSPSNMVTVSINQSATYYNTGEIEENTTYYWMVVVWDDKGWYNVSEIWHFTTRKQTYEYGVLIRNEEDFQPHDLDPNATYTLKIYWKSGEKVETYTLVNNGINGSNNFTFDEMPEVMRLYVTYPIYNETNHSIIDGYGEYYRSRVPMSNNESITFWIPKYPQNLMRYVYTIDDKTANFIPPNVILRFYIYNETVGNVGVVHEDWVTAENTLNAFLLYNSRYYLYVFNGQPPTVVYDAGFTDADNVQEKTITIQPAPAPPIGWEYIKYNAYKYGNDSIYIYYEDELGMTVWLNVTIYEYVNGTAFILDYVNVSTSKFMWIKSPVNLSRYHEVKFSFYHQNIGLEHSFLCGIAANNPPVISYTIIDVIMNLVLGSNPFGWFASFVGFMVLFVSLTLSPKYKGLSLMALALILMLIVWFFGASALLPASLLTFLLLIGILEMFYERKRGGGIT